MIAYTYITQHFFNVTCHTTLHYQGMMKDIDVIFQWIHLLVQSNLLYFGFFHQSSMTVPLEVVTVATGGIVATQERVLAVAMMALKQTNFWIGYAKDDFQHMKLP